MNETFFAKLRERESDPGSTDEYVQGFSDGFIGAQSMAPEPPQPLPGAMQPYESIEEYGLQCKRLYNLGYEHGRKRRADAHRSQAKEASAEYVAANEPRLSA